MGTSCRSRRISTSLVASDGRPRGIELRVDPTVTAAFEEATAQPDAVSEQLAEAWTQAYGRQPDPSDAWDHAIKVSTIKAVEATLIPIVCQNNAKATLSTVIGKLSSQSHRWKLLIRGKARDHSVASLVGMLQLIWPDPNPEPVGARNLAGLLTW
jgi:hypothetical protein